MLVGTGKVIVIGAGTMGAQISLDCSLAGYEVSVWDQSAQALGSLADRHNIWADWQMRKGTATQENIMRALARIRVVEDPAEAASVADILVRDSSVPTVSNFHGGWKGIWSHALGKN